MLMSNEIVILHRHSCCWRVLYNSDDFDRNVCCIRLETKSGRILVLT